MTQPGVARAQTVGTAGAVNVKSNGTAAGQPSRTIEIGSQVVRNERIDTSGTGSVQVLFVDKTSLNIGPNSTLVIDEFVFNPAEASGKLALSLGKGVLRVVGGQASHTGGATVTTAVATIGIRGGIATIEFCPTRTATCARPGLRVLDHFGEVTVTSSDGTTQTVSRSGFAVVVDMGGRFAGSPFRETLVQVDADNARLTSQRGQHGGTRVIPGDDTGVRNGLGTTNASLVPTLSVPRARAAIVTRQVAGPAAAVTPVSGADQTLLQTAIEQAAAVVTAAAVQAATPPATTPLPPGASILPTVGTATYTGTITASITAQGARYIGTGSFNDVVDFATGQGRVNVGKLDGADYAGVVSPTNADRTTFAGTLPGTAGSTPTTRQLSLNGRFAASNGSAYGQVNGSASLRGTNYLGGGTFLARKP